MRLGIVVNAMDSDEAGATTYRLAADAITMGHDVWVMSTGSLAYNGMERKVQTMQFYRRNFSNAESATLENRANVFAGLRVHVPGPAMTRVRV